MKTKLIVVIFASLLTVANAVGQEQIKQKLGDPFAISALIALKGIEGELSLPGVKNGLISVSVHTKDKLDAADAQATTEQETAVVAALNQLFVDKLLNNEHQAAIEDLYRRPYEDQFRQLEAMDRQIAAGPQSKEMRAVEASVAAGELKLHAKAAAEIEKKIATDSVLIAMSNGETACFAAFDKMLRARSTDLPGQVCSATALNGSASASMKAAADAAGIPAATRNP